MQNRPDDTVLHRYAAGEDVVPSDQEWSDVTLINGKNREGDTPLHVAALYGDLAILQSLLDHGGNPLERNNKNRTPRSQIKVKSAVKELLLGAEDAFREAKRQRDAQLWDDKMRATQTDSAFGIGIL